MQQDVQTVRDEDEKNQHRNTAALQNDNGPAGEGGEAQAQGSKQMEMFETDQRKSEITHKKNTFKVKQETMPL